MKISEVLMGGSAYELFMGRWSRAVARELLAWLSIPPNRRWLDVGCGTGSLSATILESASPLEVRGVDPFEAGIIYAQSAITDSRARFIVADAQALPPELAESAKSAKSARSDGFDAVVSGLAVNLIAKPAAAVAEMIRVAKPGAVIAAYVWDFAEGMQMLRYFWDAAIELDPAAAASDQGRLFPLCRPDWLHGLFLEAGLAGVQFRAIEAPAVFRDFGDYWSPFLNGYGRAQDYIRSLNAQRRARLEERLRAALPIRADGSIHLVNRAWAVCGIIR
jgi:SAM-dependent methyltransferase